MHTDSISIAPQDGRPVDSWALVVGGSVGIVAGFGIDFLRLGVHEARQALAGRSMRQRVAKCGWHRSHPCDAGAR
jgi:hypothetical protein